MKLTVYGVLCPEGGERSAAYRLLALAARREWGLNVLPPVTLGAEGKPGFSHMPGLYFNLSHSHGGAVCALWDQEVGVDIEKLRPPPRRLAAGRDAGAFFQWWTSMEATVKRQGRGLSTLRCLEAPDPCRILEDFLPGYMVAVCPPGPIQLQRVNATELPPESEPCKNSPERYP